MSFSRIQVLQAMEETGMVPLFYHNDALTAQKVIQACYDGGARLIEFTHRGTFAHEVFGQLVKYAAKNCPKLMLGVGSITDAGSASLYMNMGASFVVTPVLREDIARVCNRRKILWAPGCGSLTEIAQAEELGCEVVKLFPGSVYGPAFIKAVKGPQPWTKIMPTGGVDTSSKNLSEWFNAGATCVGLGSKLINQKIINNNDYTALEELVRDTLSTIKSVKK